MTFCKPKGNNNNNKKYPTLANNYTALFFSITISGNETVQILSKTLHSFFPSLWPQNNQIKYKLLFCYISIKLEEHNYW